MGRQQKGRRVRGVASIIAIVVLGGAGCGDPQPDAASPESIAERMDPGDGGDYEPQIAPSDFVEVVDNPWFPLPAGAWWRYEGRSDAEGETTEITVTDETKIVMGVRAVVVRDVVKVDGVVVEDTRDWFAQDRDGNVWYLGEAVTDFVDGEPSGTAGSWEAGVDGAKPGIVMPATPTVGTVHRQEYLVGEAEDIMRIIDTGGELDVPSGRFQDVVETEDWNPLEPSQLETKAYAKGVGKIREADVGGSSGRSELVEYHLPTSTP